MVTERGRQQTGPNTGTLLLRAFQGFQTELLNGLTRAGFKIRAKHGAVLANIDANGTRPSLLAGRAGMGKAALGELVDELQALGYVNRVADPRDGRAKLVVPTPAGQAAIQAAADVIDGIEARFRAELGETTYRRLRSALVTLVPHEAKNLQPALYQLSSRRSDV